MKLVFNKQILITLLVLMSLICLVYYDHSVITDTCSNRCDGETLKNLILDEDLEQIEAIVKNLNPNYNQNELLAVALLNHKKSSFTKLLALGFNPNITVDTNKNLILLAIQQQDIYYLEQMLEFGANANILNKNNLTEPTPLYSAIKLSRFDMVELLVTNGADIEFKSYGNYTPMMLAADLNQWQIVHFLIEAGANPYSKNDNGSTIEFNIKNNGYDPNNELSKWREKVIILMNKHQN